MIMFIIKSIKKGF